MLERVLYFALLSLFPLSQSACPSCSHNLGHKQTYSNTNDHLENPGRGFVEQYVGYASNFHPIAASYMDRKRRDTGMTMAWRTFCLDTFRTKPISTDFLNKIRRDLTTLHSVGMTAVIRFCYTFKMESKAPYGDADEKTILQHIQQLKPIFREFEGVITSVEAGFIGAWGEWYYTTYFGDPHHRNFNIDPYYGYTPQQWKGRKDVLTALLDAVPQSTQVQIRYPGMKLVMFNNPHPVSYSDVHHGTKSYVARTAHHNDCFISSDNDVGTYNNASIERPFLALDTHYLIMGGETCRLTKNDRDHCPTSLSEMKTFHWTWLNQGFDKDIYAIWEKEGCYEQVHRRLGYRLRLIESHMPDNVQGGSDFCFSITITNDGFAAPVKEMDVSLVLHHKTDGKYYRYLITNTDVRTYQPDQHKVISSSVKVPSDMPSGQYDVYLAVGDKILKHESDYYVLFANGGGVPQYSQGLNSLKHTLNVKHGSQSSHSTCGSFSPWTPPKRSKYNRLFKAPSSGYSTIIG